MTKLSGYWRRVTGNRETEETDQAVVKSDVQRRPAMFDVDIAPNDPLLIYFQNTSGVVDIGTLLISSPGLSALKKHGVKLVVPLVRLG